MAFVVKADRQIRQTNGRSPAGWTDRQTLQHQGKGYRDHRDNPWPVPAKKAPAARSKMLLLSLQDMGKDLKGSSPKPVT